MQFHQINRIEKFTCGCSYVTFENLKNKHMKDLKTMQLFPEIDSFICKEHTVTPAEASEKTHKSKSSTYRLLHIMKDAGAPITYCKQSQTYKYTEKGHFKIGFVKEK